MKRQARFPDFPRGPDGKVLKGPNGRVFCRGCKTVEIPQGRRAWCSRECVKRYHPGEVKFAVYKRDQGKCVFCECETRPFWDRWRSHPPNTPTAHFDHIIPHSEGGPFILENIRLLCEPCHKNRTKDWHKERVAKRRPQLELGV